MLEKKQKRKIHTTVGGYLFLSPVILGICIFTLVPLVESLYTSFTEYANFGDHKWVGFTNYIDLFKMPLFKTAFRNTVLYAGLSVPVNLFCSFFLAYMLNADIKGVKVYRALFYSPCIIPTAASVIVFADLFNPTFGWINQMLRVLQLPSYPFLTEVSTAIPSLIIMSMWSMGASMLIWLAAFNSISREVYEAAAIDGTNRITKLVYITIPLSTPMIFYNLIMSIIGNLQIFASVYLLTNGGPLNATTTVVMLIYNYGIGYQKMGLASAMAWLLALLIVALTSVAFITRSKWVHTED